MSLLKLRFAMLATMALLFGFLAGIFGLIVWYYGATLESNLMLAGIVAFVVLLTAVQWWAAPWLIKVTTRMRELKPNEYPELHEMLAELSRKAGIKKPRLFLVMDGTPNAFAFGRTPNDSNVAVHSGLLGVLNKEEVKAVLAHEVGHIKHWDVAVITLASMVPLLAYYLIVLFFSRQSDDRGAPSGIAVFLGALLAQFLSRLLVMYLSRTREYYADAFSAACTRKPASLANALKKISYGFAGVNPRAYESKAAFYIASPSESAELGDKAREREIDYAIEWEKTNAWAGIGELLSTHPLTFKRLAALRELEDNLPEVDAA